MILLVHTSTVDAVTADLLGRPEYSYRFVLREFMPLLRELGEVIEIADPLTEVDVTYDRYTATGEQILFLPFLPPNKIPLGLRCPTLPVFAWEFDTLPNEPFRSKPRNDWRRILKLLGGAITHSSYTVERTRNNVDPAFPIVSAPAPLWDRMQRLQHQPMPPTKLDIEGLIVDSRKTDLSPYYRTAILAATAGDYTLPLPGNLADYQGSIDLEGIIYTSIFNPYDGRKLWMFMITAFCEALRDRADATLVIKLTHYDPTDLIPELLEGVHRMGDVKCRLLLVHAYLPPENYEALLRHSTYAVNVSTGEGQCLPLMEYMSAGIPAIACPHTSMADYIDEDCAFVFDASPEINTWPHDQRQAFRTMRYRVHYHSLVDAYRRSYYIAKNEPDTYQAMSDAARASLRRYCSQQVVRERLTPFLRSQLAARRETTHAQKNTSNS